MRDGGEASTSNGIHVPEVVGSEATHYGRTMKARSDPPVELQYAPRKPGLRARWIVTIIFALCVAGGISYYRAPIGAALHRYRVQRACLRHQASPDELICKLDPDASGPATIADLRYPEWDELRGALKLDWFPPHFLHACKRKDGSVRLVAISLIITGRSRSGESNYFFGYAVLIPGSSFGVPTFIRSGDAGMVEVPRGRWRLYAARPGDGPADQCVLKYRFDDVQGELQFELTDDDRVRLLTPPPPLVAD